MTLCSDHDTATATIDSVFASQAMTALRLRASTVSDRRRKLKRLLECVSQRKDDILDAAAKDLGKHPAETILTELVPVIGELKHAIAHLKGWMRPHGVRPTMAMLGTRAKIVYQPRGRCLVISPWNYPLSLALGPLTSAVAAGNTAIIKPSEFTPNTNRVLDDIVRASFAPSEVAMIKGAVATSSHLLSLPFDHVFFTGSPGVGKIVMAAAANNLASVTLELGGKSPVIVDSSANLRDAAEQIIWGKLVNAGQTCIAPDYLYVHRDVAARFSDLCREVIRERYGATDDAIKGSRDFGRMIHRRHAERVGRLIDDARIGGGRVIFGGGYDAQSRYVSPTLLDNVPESAQIMQEEIFGPVLPMLEFHSLEDVISKINSGPKPLALYVWTKERATVVELQANTSSGSLCVNLCLQQFAHHNLPFGGVNNSGIGNAHGIFGFRAFSHERAVVSAGPVSALKLLFPPYNDKKLKLIELVMKHGT